MGRQIQFHSLPYDLKAFLEFVQNRDPVIVTERSSDTPEIRSVADPSSQTQVMILWNQAILGSLTRKHIVYPGRAYYGVDASLPTLELAPSEICDWNGREALLQGRLYGFFDNPSPEYEKWFNSLARWIRNNFVKVAIPLPGGYVGSAAYDWFKKGGLLLPGFRPPQSGKWLSWVEAQDQQRAVF